MNFILPMAIMALIIIFLTLRLMFLAGKFIYAKDISIDQFQLYDGEFPDKLKSARYQFQNMFEIPLLFFPLCISHMILNNSTTLDHIFVWGFVIFRILHMFFRLKNQRGLNIRPRTFFFLISLLLLGAGWIKLLLNSFCV
ncbi:MAG: hypothetical protein CMG61_02290 [Candidatus Marinimicrobia bacterium]|nr:hypothetical protein [Candidatus Neomarinimicrobiota bacterium]